MGYLQEREPSHAGLHFDRSMVAGQNRPPSNEEPRTEPGEQPTIPQLVRKVLTEFLPNLCPPL